MKVRLVYSIRGIAFIALARIAFSCGTCMRRVIGNSGM